VAVAGNAVINAEVNILHFDASPDHLLDVVMAEPPWPFEY
jgi:hypothetical protein